MTNLLVRSRKTAGHYKRQFLQSDFYLSLRDTYRQTQVKQRSPFDNIYYCCTQKTASQWFRAVFDDADFFQYTGLRTLPFEELGLNHAELQGPFPTKTLVTHLYVDYPTYAALPKPRKYRTFFILRDPRDLVTSWYFSAKISHKPVWPIPEMRAALEGLDETDGLKYVIDKVASFGTFEAQRGWVEAATIDPNANVFRYEDFAADNGAFLAQLLNYLQIKMPAAEFEALCDRHAYSKKAKGRAQGEENVDSHYRKGVAGDWENHFNDEIMAHFRAVTGDTLEVLGYE